MEAIHAEKIFREEREAERLRWEKEQLIRQQMEEKREELKQFELLEQYAANWDKADKIRRFADSIELKLAEIESEDEKEKLVSWLKWAREKVDWLDPLVEKDDEVLGRSRYIFDFIIE